MVGALIATILRSPGLVSFSSFHSGSWSDTVGPGPSTSQAMPSAERGKKRMQKSTSEATRWFVTEQRRQMSELMVLQKQPMEVVSESS